MIVVIEQLHLRNSQEFGWILAIGSNNAIIYLKSLKKNS